MEKIATVFLDLDKIADSGQCFRWREVGDREYIIPAFGKELHIKQDGPEAVAARGNLIEEVADVFIMLVQLVRMFDGAEEVQQTVDEKLHRLKSRLERGGRTNEQQQ